MSLLARRAAPDAEVSAKAGTALQRIKDPLSNLLKGKELAVEAILSALLSRGHVLLEDVPGVGKTTLVKAIARVLGLDMKRIQCTSDLLPSDIVGVEVYEGSSGRFQFHKGPIFANLILADELNRASPRTQSALLEAMGEGGVTVDRVTHQLPHPFLLFATQNPNEHLGTYPLPESQLDRFSIRLQLSYPVAEKEREIFHQSTLDPLASIPASVLTAAELQGLQDQVERVHLSDAVVHYVSRVADATRSHGQIQRGISTRGGIAWIRVAKGRAFLLGRDYVTPDDLIAMGAFALAHRIVVQPGNDAISLIEKILNSVDVV